MSKIIDTLKSRDDLFAENGVSSTIIRKAEIALGLTFAQEFKDYLMEFGCVSYGSHELTGFSADENLDVVNATIKNRQRIAIGRDCYVIEEAHIDGIVIWQSSDGSIFQTAPYSNTQKIANSLEEYIKM